MYISQHVVSSQQENMQHVVFFSIIVKRTYFQQDRKIQFLVSFFKAKIDANLVRLQYKDSTLFKENIQPFGDNRETNMPELQIL